MIDFAAARTAMVDCQVRPSDVTRYPIIEAMLTVPREEYVPDDKRAVAYAGDHLELGGNRVVPDARVLAKTLDALDVQPTELVLCVGAGLGYTPAVLAQLAEMVIAVEEDEALAAQAEARLTAQSADRAVVVTGPLAAGAAKHGPYDVILVDGGVEDIPAALTDQLKEGGRIAATFRDGATGQVKTGIKTVAGIAWRRAFDATSPVLPGFEKAAAFVF